ncbi:Putative exodeoxyribonuclease 8, PDDEXK-like domain containing protein [uncultured Caudovirales phage]|uniref:Exodeoxyribonuclease 8, PDDEXK-like domain containing protein n=1 Tax=uncultured Caudovirales phage TaxID=2100421 RepID=A0A6J5LVL7_9CAUD|nr:Putative exodeoxyribonuclease 8, PDDEXK-like domain containing protein [uncultured Caudovirales phage]
MDTGIYAGIPEERYHAGDQVSVSRLKLFAIAPAKARWAPPRTSRPLAMGKLLHTAILEPAELERRYYPTSLARINERDSATQAALLRAGERELVKQADYDDARRAADAVHKWSAVVRELITPDLATEQSAYWQDPGTGLRCRGRVDGAHAIYRTLIDLKSARNATPDAFKWTVAEYGYHWQEAMYRDGWELAGGWRPEVFLFFAVELEPPYLTGIYELSPKAVSRGWDMVRHYLAEWAECARRDEWPGLPADAPIQLELPPVAYME